MNSTIAPLDSPKIWYAGQIIAVVIRQTPSRRPARPHVQLKVEYVGETAHRLIHGRR